MIWKGKAIQYNRFLFLLQVSAHRTKDKEFGLLPTPMASEGNKMTGSITENQMSLTKMVRQGFLPTPTSMEDRSLPQTWDKRYERKKAEGINLQMGLTTMARKGMLPTPSSRDYKDSQSPEKYQIRKELWEKKKINLQLNLPQKITNEIGQISRLSPLFVGEMMGFPENWTTSPFLNGELNQSKPTGTQ